MALCLVDSALWLCRPIPELNTANFRSSVSNVQTIKVTRLETLLRGTVIIREREVAADLKFAKDFNARLSVRHTFSMCVAVHAAQPPQEWPAEEN